VSPNAANGEVDQPVDRAVDLGDAEQVGDPDKHDEEVAREHGEEVVCGHPTN
jgi:hypothetical protein